MQRQYNLIHKDKEFNERILCFVEGYKDHLNMTYYSCDNFSDYSQTYKRTKEVEEQLNTNIYEKTNMSQVVRGRQITDSSKNKKYVLLIEQSKMQKLVEYQSENQVSGIFEEDNGSTAILEDQLLNVDQIYDLLPLPEESDLIEDELSYVNPSNSPNSMTSTSVTTSELPFNEIDNKFSEVPVADQERELSGLDLLSGIQDFPIINPSLLSSETIQEKSIQIFGEKEQLTNPQQKLLPNVEIVFSYLYTPSNSILCPYKTKIESFKFELDSEGKKYICNPLENPSISSQKSEIQCRFSESVLRALNKAAQKKAALIGTGKPFKKIPDTLKIEITKEGMESLHQWITGFIRNIDVTNVPPHLTTSSIAISPTNPPNATNATNPLSATNAISETSATNLTNRMRAINALSALSEIGARNTKNLRKAKTGVTSEIPWVFFPNNNKRKLDLTAQPDPKKQKPNSSPEQEKPTSSPEQHK